MNGISVFRESDRPFVRTLSIEEDDHVYDRKARELDEVAHAAEMECEDDWMSGVDVSRFARDLAPEFEKMGERSHPSTSYDGDHRMFPKPAYSYSCLIALAMKNSKSGQLTVAEIYAFMCEHFPYFRTAPSGWKNSVRHNLSLNKCFMKVEVEHPGQLGRKSCLWMIRPEKAAKMESDIQKWREKNPMAIEGAMPRPQDLAAIQEGRQGVPMEDRSLRTSSAENSVPAVKSVLTIRQNMSQSTSSPRPSIDLNNRVREGVEIRIRDRDDDTIIRVGSSNTRVLPSSLPTQYSPAEKLSDLLPLECMPKLQNTPPRAEIKMEKEEFSITLRPSDLSPVQVGYSSYEAVHDALTNNSLLACALDQSPYKGPVTFPSNMRL